MYQNASHNISQDMNLEFVMATEKAGWNYFREEAGVERIKWETTPSYVLRTIYGWRR